MQISLQFDEFFQEQKFRQFWEIFQVWLHFRFHWWKKHVQKSRLSLTQDFLELPTLRFIKWSKDMSTQTVYLMTWKLGGNTFHFLIISTLIRMVHMQTSRNKSLTSCPNQKWRNLLLDHLQLLCFVTWKTRTRHSVWKSPKMSHLNFGIFHQFSSY